MLGAAMDERAGLAVVRLRGSSSEIGHQHGQVLRERVRATWAFYKSVFESIGVSETELRHVAALARTAIQAFDDRYAVEMDAIAAGAGLEPWEIMCLNARTEVLVRLRGRTAECTSIFDTKQAVLAQNWDWDEFLEKQIFMADIELEDGHRILTMTEPGMLAKAGMSSAGVGTTLNALGLDPESVGVPIHVLLRAALDAPSFDVALERLMTAPRGTSAHILLGSADGRHAVVEFAGRIVEVVPARGRFALHTNHYLGCGLSDHPILGFPASGPADSCSRGRLQRATMLVAQLADTEHANVVDAIVEILHDSQGAWPICRPMRKATTDSLSSALGRVGTVCTVIMDLAGCRLLATRGNPFDNPDLIELRLN